MLKSTRREDPLRAATVHLPLALALLFVAPEARAFFEIQPTAVVVATHTVIPGQTTTVDVTVLRTGTTAPASFSNRVFAAVNGTCTTPVSAALATWTLSGLGSTTSTLSITIPGSWNPPGGFVICAETDYLDQRSEVNESNNLLADPTTVLLVECITNDDCEDSTLCNGPNLCQSNECQEAPVICNDSIDCTVDNCIPATGLCSFTPQHALCDDAVGCTADVCDTVVGCENTPDDALCDDTLWCNGAETCDAVLDCQAGTAPDPNDNVGCTTDSCNESTDSIDNVPDDDACDDGLFCTGDGVCDVVLDCQYPNPVVCDLLTPCFDGSCNMTTGDCDQTPVTVPPGPAICADADPHMEGIWSGFGGGGPVCAWELAIDIQHTLGQTDFSGSFDATLGTCAPTDFSGTLTGYASGGTVWMTLTSPSAPTYYDDKSFTASPRGDRLLALEMPGGRYDEAYFRVARIAPDSDLDEVSDPTENGAPNAGDGNGDGTLDSLQANVTSLPNAESGDYITLEVAPGCAGLTDVRVFTHDEAIEEEYGYLSPLLADPAHTYPVGLVAFEAACSSAEIKIYFHGATPVGPPYRKLGPEIPGDALSTAWYTLDPPAAVFGSDVVGGETVTTVTLSLTDGIKGDDTAVDGLIVDAGGPVPYDPQQLPTLGARGVGILAGSILLGFLLSRLVVRTTRGRFGATGSAPGRAG